MEAVQSSINVSSKLHKNEVYSFTFNEFQVPFNSYQGKLRHYNHIEICIPSCTKISTTL